MVYLILSGKDGSSVELCSKVKGYLKERGIGYVTDYDGGSSGEELTVVIAVGDDGLILSTFRMLGKRVVPVLGISTGASVLSEADAENYKSVIESIQKGEFNIQKRTRIVAIFGGNEGDGKETAFALNEIGVFPGRSAEILRYTLSIDGKHSFKDNADGVIVSTPTGSTGYAMSCGGPMVIDEPEIFTITPVSSMSKSYSPLVVSNASRIRISGMHAKSGVCAVIDGTERVSIDADSLEIVRSDFPALFVKPKFSQSIVEKLRKRTFTVDHDMVKSMPASAKLVYKALLYEGEMTQKEIISETYLPARTARYALELLLRKNMISKKPNLNDVRQTVYSV